MKINNNMNNKIITTHKNLENHLCLTKINKNIFIIFKIMTKIIINIFKMKIHNNSNSNK